MLERWFGQQRWEWAVGLALTAAALGLCLGHATERIELNGYDYFVRHFSRIDAAKEIVHVDIDDDALDRVGSWPWPRDLQAELIGILHELGARQIVMDIVFSEPKPAEVRLPALDRYADLEGQIEQIGEFSAENLVSPDDELAAAVGRAGNVFLAMYYVDREAGQETALTQGMAELLRKDFGLGVKEVAERLGEPAASVEAVLAGVKRRVALELVGGILRANPSADARQVHQAILTTPFERLTADRADVLAAYHVQLGLRELRRLHSPVPSGLAGKLPKVGRMIPPVYKFTAAAKGVGFVNFTPDYDGYTRHVPLLMEWDGLLIEQLALAAAREALDIRLEDLSIDGAGDLLIAARGRRPALRVQLDARGQMLINWHVPIRQWQRCFPHLPVTQLLRIYDCHKGIKENQVRRQQTLGRALWLVKGKEGFDVYRRQVNTLLEKQRLIRQAELHGQGETAEVKTARTEADRLGLLIENDRKQTIAYITETWKELAAEANPNDPRIAEDYKRFREAHDLITARLAELDQANARLEAERQRWLTQLRPMVNDKTCFVGYTATAVADMVTTPAFGRMPGVLVHSNVFNNLAEGQFRTWATRPVQLAVVVLFGVLMTWLTVTHGPRKGFIVMLVLVLAVFLLNALAVFYRLDHWLRLITALILAFFVWALIVLVRYLTTERQRRRFSRAVSQYVSPAMAKRLAGEAVNLDLAPVEGKVTCFFSDLAGFTSLSEQLGPEGTKTLLNPYLEAMSAVLHRHNALINKFMGDGIFAFYNPPILPCAEHELAACASALDCRSALGELAARYAEHPLADFFRRLHMRIGLASGPVFVGDYGSESKLDYTCMGDTVNLASRLESANKQFASVIMLTGAIRQTAGERYLYRHLGALQVKGQTVAVPVYELLGRPGEVDGELVKFADLFSAAVAAFGRRDWASALNGFESCLRIRSGDPGAVRYLQAVRYYRDNPPPENWSTALELTEK